MLFTIYPSSLSALCIDALSPADSFTSFIISPVLSRLKSLTLLENPHISSVTATQRRLRRCRTVGVHSLIPVMIALYRTCSPQEESFAKPIMTVFISGALWQHDPCEDVTFLADPKCQLHHYASGAVFLSLGDLISFWGIVRLFCAVHTNKTELDFQKRRDVFRND